MRNTYGPERARDFRSTAAILDISYCIRNGEYFQMVIIMLQDCAHLSTYV